MSYNIIITNDAEENLVDIACYIAEDNPLRAESFLEEMSDFFTRRLESIPLSAIEVKKGIRMLPYKRYSIFYTVNKEAKIVSVLHVFAGGRDWDILV